MTMAPEQTSYDPEYEVWLFQEQPFFWLCDRFRDEKKRRQHMESVLISVPITNKIADAVRTEIRNLVNEDFHSFYPNIIISYATGNRKDYDADGAGPGLMVAAAVIKLLFDSDYLCYSDMMTPDDGNLEECMLRLEQAKVMVVLVTETFFLEVQCLREVAGALYQGVTLILVRCDETITDKKDMWPDEELEKYAGQQKNTQTLLPKLRLMREDAANKLERIGTIPVNGSILSEVLSTDQLMKRISELVPRTPGVADYAPPGGFRDEVRSALSSIREPNPSFSKTDTPIKAPQMGPEDVVPVGEHSMVVGMTPQNDTKSNMYNGTRIGEIPGSGASWVDDSIGHKIINGPSRPTSHNQHTNQRQERKTKMKVDSDRPEEVTQGGRTPSHPQPTWIDDSLGYKIIEKRLKEASPKRDMTSRNERKTTAKKGRNRQEEKKKPQHNTSNRPPSSGRRGTFSNQHRDEGTSLAVQVPIEDFRQMNASATDSTRKSPKMLRKMLKNKIPSFGKGRKGVTPKDIDWKDECKDYNEEGLLLFGKGKYPGALTCFHKALHIQQAHEPGANFVASTLSNVGMVLKKQRDFHRALPAYRAALDIRRENMNNKEGTSAQTIRALASSYNNIGSILMEMGKLDEALQQHDHAIRVLEPNSLEVADTRCQIGAVLHQQEKVSEAIHEYNKALEIQQRKAPNAQIVAEAHCKIGSLYHSQGNSDQALHHYRSALIVEEKLRFGNKQDSSCTRRVAEMHSRIGSLLEEDSRFQDALVEYETEIAVREELGSSSKSKNAELALCHLKIGNFLVKTQRDDSRGALVHYQKALTASTKASDRKVMAESYYQIGMLLCELRENENALENLKKALEIQQRQSPVDSSVVANTLRSIGTTLERQGDFNEALLFYKSAMESSQGQSDPAETTELHKRVESIKSRIAHAGSEPPEHADMTYTRQRILLREAEEGQKNPLEEASDYSKNGSVLQNQGALDGALREFRKALNILEREMPGSLQLAECHIKVGYILHEQHDLDSALSQYHKAREIQELDIPNTLTVATTYNNIGSVLKEQGDYSGALDYLHKDLEIQKRDDPGSLDIATSFNNIGMVLKEQGDSDAALSEFQRALSIQEVLAPDSLELANTYINIGSLRKESGELDGALREFRKALAIRRRERPISLESATCYSHMGTVLRELGDKDGALEYFSWSHDLLIDGRLNLPVSHPRLVKCKLELANTCIDLERYEEAIVFVDGILSFQPSYAWAYEAKGRALSAQFRYEEAIAAFDEALKLSPNFDAARLGRMKAEIEFQRQHFYGRSG